jgi:antitoxin YefM
LRTINFTYAKIHLKEVLDTVGTERDVTIIRRRAAEDVIVMSASEYSSVQETLYLLGGAANAIKLQAALAEADMSLPPDAIILGPNAT